MKPSKEQRQKLVMAGSVNHDALDIVNEFNRRDPDVTLKIFDDWWQLKICILAERIVRAEKHLKECRNEIGVLHRTASTKGQYVELPDDGHLVDEAWLNNIGIEETQFGWEFYDEAFPLYLNRSKTYLNVWHASIDGSPWPGDIHSRGCVRRLLVALQRIVETDPCKHGVHTWDIVEDVSESSGNVDRSVKCVLCGYEDSIDCIELDAIRERQNEWPTSK